MGTSANDLELAERLNLIEAMISEGRRRCESWGWTFVLWGVAYYAAFFWGAWGHFAYAWPVTVIAASLLTMAGFWRTNNQPNTTMGRAIASVWIAMGISMFILFDALGFGGHLQDARIFFAAASAMLGMANAACSLMLKWKAEFACALVWWAAAVIASFGSVDAAVDAFLAAIFLCQIVFGIYAMMLESRRKAGGAVHG
ncbi:MAG: hypothetical protein WBA18_12715 [Terracidiphilus sp.]